MKTASLELLVGASFTRKERDGFKEEARHTSNLAPWVCAYTGRVFLGGNTRRGHRGGGSGGT